MKPKTLVRLSLLLVLSSCSCFIQASKPNVDWTTYGGSLDNQRYSELNDINKDNVKNLRLSWEFSLPTPTSALYSNFESTPLVVGGKMYITSPIDEVYKLNTEPASKHRQIWEYKTANRYPLTVANVQQYLCCGMINRGV